MSEFTKEHFEETLDKKLKGLATMSNLQTAVAPLATKQDIREGVEELARITSGGFAHAEERFDDIETRLDVTAKLKVFERKFQKLEEALHITL